LETTKKFPLLFKSRQFIFKAGWYGPDPEDGSYIYFYEPHEGVISETDISYDNNSFVRGENTGFMKMTPLPGSTSRCEFKVVQRIDACGYVPMWVGKLKLKHSLSTPNELLKKFNKDEELDSQERDDLAQVMKDYTHENYSPEETASIDAIQKLAEAASKDLIPIDSPSHLVTMKRAVIEGDPNSIGYGEVILDASIEDSACTEYIHDRKWLKGFYEDSGGVMKNVFHFGNHCKVVRSIYRAKISGIDDREFRWKFLWQKLDDDNIIVVYEPIDKLDDAWGFPDASSGVVRATSWMLKTFQKFDSVGRIPQTKMTILTHVNLSGNLPAKLVSKKLPGRLMHLDRTR